MSEAMVFYVHNIYP